MTSHTGWLESLTLAEWMEGQGSVTLADWSHSHCLSGWRIKDQSHWLTGVTHTGWVAGGISTSVNASCKWLSTWYLHWVRLQAQSKYRVTSLWYTIQAAILKDVQPGSLSPRGQCWPIYNYTGAQVKLGQSQAKDWAGSVSQRMGNKESNY